MSYKRCDACRGQKKVKGLGCMLRKCEACNGSGYVEQDEQDIVKDVNVDNDNHELDIEIEKPKAKRKGNPNWRKKE